MKKEKRAAAGEAAKGFSMKKSWVLGMMFALAAFAAERADAQAKPPMYLELRGGPTVQAGADFVSGASYWQLEKEGAGKGTYADKPIDAITPALAFALPLEGKFHLGLLAPSNKFGGLELTLPFTFTYALPYTGDSGLAIHSLNGTFGVWLEVKINF